MLSSNHNHFTLVYILYIFFKKMKTIVLYSDKNYYYHTLNAIESFRRAKDRLNFIYFQIGFDRPAYLYDMDIECVSIMNPPEIPANLPWGGMLVYKPYIMNLALKMVDDFIYVDSDILASKYFDYNRLVDKITDKPYGCRLHETEWQFPIHWTMKDGIRTEYTEKGLMDYLGVSNRTQPWITACMMAVNKSCQNFIQEYENISLNYDLLNSKEHEDPYKYYFHMGCETIYNVLLWKYGATDYFEKNLIIEPKKISTILEIENGEVLDRQIEEDNKMTYVYDNKVVAIYHQLKDLDFRTKVLIALKNSSIVI